MARITIDDCLKFIPNRFDLTLSATNRARQIAHGAAPMVAANRDKPTVIALREMAAGKYGVEILVKNQTDANQTDAKSLPAAATANETTWRRITETLDDTAKEEKVVAQAA